MYKIYAIMQYIIISKYTSQVTKIKNGNDFC